METISSTMVCFIPGSRPGTGKNAGVQKEIDSTPAKLLGHIRAQEARFPHFAPGRLVGNAGLIPLRQVGDQLRLREAAEFGTKVLVLV